MNNPLAELCAAISLGFSLAGAVALAQTLKGAPAMPQLRPTTEPQPLNIEVWTALEDYLETNFLEFSDHLNLLLGMPPGDNQHAHAEYVMGQISKFVGNEKWANLAAGEYRRR